MKQGQCRRLTLLRRHVDTNCKIHLLTFPLRHHVVDILNDPPFDLSLATRLMLRSCGIALKLSGTLAPESGDNWT